MPSILQWDIFFSKIRSFVVLVTEFYNFYDDNHEIFIIFVTGNNRSKVSENICIMAAQQCCSFLASFLV